MPKSKLAKFIDSEIKSIKLKLKESKKGFKNKDNKHKSRKKYLHNLLKMKKLIIEKR